MNLEQIAAVIVIVRFLPDFWSRFRDLPEIVYLRCQWGFVLWSEEQLKLIAHPSPLMHILYPILWFSDIFTKDRTYAWHEKKWWAFDITGRRARLRENMRQQILRDRGF